MRFKVLKSLLADFNCKAAEMKAMKWSECCMNTQLGKGLRMVSEKYKLHCKHCSSRIRKIFNHLVHITIVFIHSILYGSYPKTTEADVDEILSRSKYWKEDYVFLVQKEKLSLLKLALGGCSVGSRQFRSKWLIVGLVTSYLANGIRLYIDVFSLLLTELQSSLNSIDSSGSIASVLTTAILMVSFCLFALLWVPSFVMNNIKANLAISILSLVYYMTIQFLFITFILRDLIDDSETNDSLATIDFSWLVLSIITIAFNIMISIYSICLSFIYPKNVYWFNRTRSFRVYTFKRLDGMGRKVLLLPSRDHDKAQFVMSSELDLLTRAYEVLWPTSFSLVHKTTWTPKGLIKNIGASWIPSSETFRHSDYLFELPDTIFASIILGIYLLILIGLSVHISAVNVYDNIGARIAYLNEVLDILTNFTDSEISNSTVTFVENVRDFWKELQYPLFLSLELGAFFGLGWTASFIPSVALGFKRTMLELRLGILDAPGFQNHNREVNMPPSRAPSFFGCYISCVIFSWLLSSIVFGLVVLLFTWPPFWRFVWSLNYLWLPALFSVVVSTITNHIVLSRYCTHTSPSRGEKSINKHESMTLTKPDSFTLLELGFSLSYLPTYGWAAFMRAVYVLTAALLGLLRVDWSLLPSGAHTFDSPYVAFAALALRSNPTDSAIFTVCAEMLLSYDKKKRHTKAYLRARTRFWLMLVLNRYPGIRIYRKKPAKTEVSDVELEKNQEPLKNEVSLSLS